MTDESMIKIERLSHYYPSRARLSPDKSDGNGRKGERALNNIDLKIAKGQRLVLLGSSGAGKSTLLRCTNLSVTPTEGRVFIDGAEITRLPAREVQRVRRQIGVISQHFNLVEGASALRNVLLGRLGYVSTARSMLGRFGEEDRAIAADCLARVGLDQYAQKRVSDLSGGQKQRVAVARALAQHPTVLLADEPVSSLDPKLMREIMELVQQVCLESDITLIATLHLLELAKRYATRIVGMRMGQIVFDGTPDEMTDKDIIDIYGETEEWVLYGRTGF
jgi:phosphonate transport system ATP-binding protein